MGELILCSSQLAGIPYYIEQSMLNIYSAEELCYYLLNDTECLDYAFVTEELCDWLETELHRKDTAETLRKQKREQRPMAELAATMLDTCGFCRAGEKRQIQQMLYEVENKSELECQKIRADRNLKNHRYVMAIRDYVRLLYHEELKQADAVLTGNIWNNLGTAHACLFLYKDAARCFDKAYQYNNQSDCLQSKLDALEMEGMKDTEIVSEELEEQLEEIRKELSAGHQDAAEAMWQKQIEKQKQIYAGSVKFS